MKGVPKGTSPIQVLTNAAKAVTAAIVVAGPVTPHERWKDDVMCWNAAPDASCIWSLARTRRPLYPHTSLLEVEDLTSSNFLGFPMVWRRTRQNLGTPLASEKGERTETIESEGDNC